MDSIKDLNDLATKEIGVYNLKIHSLNKEEAILTTVKQVQADVDKLSKRIEALDETIENIKSFLKSEKVGPQDELKAKMLIATAKERAAQIKKIEKRLAKLRQ